MKDDSGPTMDCPCRSKIKPKINETMPIPIIGYPLLMTILFNFY